MKICISKWLSVALLVWFCAGAAYSAGEKERMLQRVPQIKMLKAEGVIGEKADGLLGYVKSGSKSKAMVDAENKDRKAVYSAIAEKQGVRVSVVAERRALQLVEQAAKGDWLQDKSGKWVQKK